MDQGPACALNLREQNAFQSGGKRIAIITEAASTGISLHSDRRRLGIGFMPRQRTLILAELGFSADKTMQQLGRVHRSNQYVAPHFEVVLSQVPGEARLAFTLARKLKTLGAVTRGNQHGATVNGKEGLSEAVSSLEMSCNQAEAALHRMADEFRGVLDSDGPNKELAAAFMCLDIGLGSVRAHHDADFQVSKVVNRFLGRSMMLPIRLQQGIFERFQSYLEELVTLEDRPPTSVGNVIKADISSEEWFAMGPLLPSCRMLRLEVEGRAEILLAGPILSLLKLCPELSGSWKLTRYRVSDEGVQTCGVVVTEDQLREIMSAARHLQASTAPSHVVQASPCLAGRAGAEDQSTTPLPCQKRRKLSNSTSVAAYMHDDDSRLQTPRKPVNTCMSRTWAGGAGRRCARPANDEPSREGGGGGDFCLVHAKEAARNGGVPVHGRMDGAIPEAKRTAFEAYRSKLANQSLKNQGPLMKA